MKQSDIALIDQRREDVPEPARKTPFVNFLCLQQHGDLVQALSDELGELIRGVQNVGKAGKMAFEIKVSPGGMRKVEVTVTHKTSVPKESEPETILYVDDRGGVYGCDPDQMLMSFTAKKVEMPEPIIPSPAPVPLSANQ